MFSGALRFIDNLHFDWHSKTKSTKAKLSKVVDALNILNSVFKDLKLKSILEHFAELIALDDESYWKLSPPNLPNC